MIDGRREIGGRGRIAGRIGGVLVGLAVDLAAANAAAGEQDGVALRPVFAAAVAARDLRRAAELGGHNDQRLVQPAGLLQIGHQGVERLVEGRNEVFLVGAKLFQCVSQAKPFLPCVRCQLHCTSRAPASSRRLPSSTDCPNRLRP